MWFSSLLQSAKRAPGPLVLVAVLALAAGYALPRPPARRGGDMLDAVAAVQRRSPHFLVSEPFPSANWLPSGTLYLCRTTRSAEDVERLSKDPRRADPRWAGVVCFKGTADPQQVGEVPWVARGGDRC